jgi:hypothetical protein
VSQRVRILAAAALVAALALGAGILVLGGGGSSSAAVPEIKPLHPVKHHLRSTPKKTAKATPVAARKKPKRSTPSVIDGVPASLAFALRANDVVVVSLYAPKSSVDQLALAEARQGADMAGAGFVALNVADEKVAAPLTSLLTGGATAADRVLDDPAVLVFQAPRTLFVRLNGFNDRETVAQAAANAGAIKVTVSPSGTWASQANAICTQMDTDILGLTFPTNASQALDWIDKLDGILAAGVRKLHALKPPHGRAAQVRQMLSYYDTAIAGLHSMIVQARAGKTPDVSGYQQKLADAGLKADALARDLGATACGGSSSLGQ